MGRICTTIADYHPIFVGHNGGSMVPNVASRCPSKFQRDVIEPSSDPLFDMRWQAGIASRHDPEKIALGASVEPCRDHRILQLAHEDLGERSLPSGSTLDRGRLGGDQQRLAIGDPVEQIFSGDDHRGQRSGIAEGQRHSIDTAYFGSNPRQDLCCDMSPGFRLSVDTMGAKRPANLEGGPSWRSTRSFGSLFKLPIRRRHGNPKHE